MRGQTRREIRKAYKLWKALVLLVIAGVFYFLYAEYDLFDSNVYTSMKYCQTIATPPGPEDLHMVGRYAISGYKKHISVPEENYRSKIKGGVIAIDPEKLESYNLPLKNFPKNKTFHPLGLNVLNNSTLYFINSDHVTKRDYIESFKIEDTNGNLSLTYLRTISFVNPYFSQLNDLYFVDNKTFYVTKWLFEPRHTEHGFIGQQIVHFQTMFKKFTDVLLCRIRHSLAICKEQDTGHMMNGIDTDGKDFFVTDTANKKVYQYSVNKDKSLKRISTIDINANGDNIVYDAESGKFYIGVIRYKDFMKGEQRVRKGEVVNMASGVVELYKENGKWKSKLLFMQKDLTGLSTPLRKGNKLILGSWLDSKILVCPNFN